ncbi:MAG: hypothetical protein ACI9F9_001213 [Candidatus Paceibacteria bacterium]|jgi:hypothetical protein
MIRQQLHATLRTCALPLLVALCSALPAQAREKVTVTMTAPSEIEAIRYALAEAVGRVNGVEVSTAGKLHPELAEVVQRLEIDFDPQRKDPFHIRSISHGYVRSYEVHTAEVSDAGTTVEIEAEVLTFDPANPRPGARPTVVVEGFSMGAGALQLDHPAVGAEILLVGLRDDLEASLVRSHKFSVLTRKNLSGLLREQAFLEGDKVGPTEKIKLHQMLGGDYVVSGRIDRIYVHTETKTVKLTGFNSQTKAADVSMTLNLYNVATGQLEWSTPYERSYRWNSAELKADPSFADDGIVARTMVIDAGAQLSKDLVRQVFPLRVIEVDREAPGGVVFYLNAGKDTVKIGARFELVQLGKELRDPQTGELLGHRERVVGLVHIVRQTAKLSQAEWIDPKALDEAWFDSETFDPAQLACRAL